MSNHWVPSRYTFSAKLLDKGRILYNSYTGAISLASPEEEEKVQFILAAGIDHDGRCDLAKDMCESGFLVPSGTKEFERAEELHQALKAEKSSHLVLLTTEACNFRCSYCYQTFAQGMMTEETIQGLKAHVAQSVQHLEHLSISWFGGEPLLAYESIIELSDSFLKSCAENHVSYSADMSTNGYFLTKERCKELLKRNVRRYMITLDGVGEVHDRRRTLVGGSGTYEKIIHQLKEIQELDDSFVIDLRVNFDEENVEDIPELLRTLADLFGDDPRFQLLLRPVGRWGGTKDQHIPVCDRTASDKHLWSLTECGVQQGLKLSDTIADTLMPSGAVCYAAKPNSFIVGADGQLYKCSVAFEEEMNQVGKLQHDGTMELDLDKMALWTIGGEEQDVGCQNCYFRPACQGNHCPLYRMRTKKRPCPHEKRKLKQVLNLLC